MKIHEILEHISHGIQPGDVMGIDVGDITLTASVEYVTIDGPVLCLDNTGWNLLMDQQMITEAEYHGRKVTLNKPTQGDVKKSKVFVKNPKTGKIVKVNFGDKKLSIKKHIPARRKSFRARHHCETPGPKTKAKYWSCRAW